MNKRNYFLILFVLVPQLVFCMEQPTPTLGPSQNFVYRNQSQFQAELDGRNGVITNLETQISDHRNSIKNGRLLASLGATLISGVVSFAAWYHFKPLYPKLNSKLIARLIISSSCVLMLSVMKLSKCFDFMRYCTPHHQEIAQLKMTLRDRETERNQLFIEQAAQDARFLREQPGIIGQMQEQTVSDRAQIVDLNQRIAVIHAETNPITASNSLVRRENRELIRNITTVKLRLSVAQQPNPQPTAVT